MSGTEYKDKLISSLVTEKRGIKDTLKSLYKLELDDKVYEDLEGILKKYGDISVAYRPLSTVEAFENKLYLANDLTLYKRGSYEVRVEELVYLMNNDGLNCSFDTYICFDDKHIVDANWNTKKHDDPKKKAVNQNIALILSTRLETGNVPASTLYMYILNTNLNVGAGNIIFEDISDEENKGA